MGGEWFFYFEGDSPTDFPVSAYQECLTTEIAPWVQNWEYDIHEYTKVKLYECKEREETNLFATFSYRCPRHDWHGQDQTSWSLCKQDQASWSLFWDPTVVENTYSDVHARCAP
jgi:hypothetical protein